jgi:hypothetical protein
MRVETAGSHRWAIVATVVAFTISGAANARADFAYAFAQETVSNMSVTRGTSLMLVPVASATTAGATFNGSGSSTSDALDALQAYLGASPAPPQNYFQRYAGFPSPSPLPAGSAPNGVTTGPGPLADFTRGDSLISNSGTTFSVVAESYRTTGFAGGTSGLLASFSFIPATTGAATISYNYANDLYASAQGAQASAQASYQFNFTIKDAAGLQVASLQSPSTNLGLGVPPNGGEIVRSGSESFTTSSLTAGAQYTVTVSESAQTFAQPTAGPFLTPSPEPGSIILTGLGIALFLTHGTLRRGRKAVVSRLLSQGRI